MKTATAIHDPVQTANCSTCRAPGACCRFFFLNGGITNELQRGTLDEVIATLKKLRLPFRPVPAPIGQSDSERHLWVYDCDLLKDGKCTVHGTDEQPDLCKSFDPGENYLCAEYVPTFRGIPITVKRV